MAERITIQDIADALGLSRNTVSKAINNTGILADATREKVLKKAIELGYKQFSYINIPGIEIPGADSGCTLPLKKTKLPCLLPILSAIHILRPPCLIIFSVEFLIPATPLPCTASRKMKSGTCSCQIPITWKRLPASSAWKCLTKNTVPCSADLAPLSFS